MDLQLGRGPWNVYARSRGNSLTDTEDRRRVLAVAASHAGMKEWLEGRRQLALDMMKGDYDRIADKDTFFRKSKYGKVEGSPVVETLAHCGAIAPRRHMRLHR